MQLREAITKILKKENLENCILPPKNDIYSYNEAIEEFSNEALIELAVSFVHGYILKNKQQLSEYIENIEYFKIVPKEIISIRIKLEEKCEWERTEKIKINQIKKMFKDLIINFDDREWIIKMLVYLYILAFEELYFYKFEMEVLESRNKIDLSVEPLPKMKILRVQEINTRKNLLVNRNKPTMSLDEYAEKAKRAMMLYEGQMKQNTLVDQDEEIIESNKSNDDDLLRILRETDEFNDDNLRGSGNRKNYG